MKRDGTVWAWGANYFGQLGNNGNENSPIPVRVQGLEGVAVTAIYAGGDNGGALDPDGALWMWGDNSNRQIGDSTQRFAIKAAENIQAVSIGSGFVMALGTDGKLRLRGSNRYGQIGNGESGSVKIVSSFYEVPLSGVSSIFAGQSHAVAVTSDGKVYTWGQNNIGQLGNGESGGDLVSAVPVMAGITDVAVVYAGGNCNYAEKANGEIWVWGYNYWGQLGADLPTLVATPARLTLPGISAVTSIAANTYHTLFLDQEGNVWGMGSNSNDVLGNNGHDGIYNSPVNVVNPDGNGVFNLFADPSGNTNVKATAVIPAPTYTVTIPAEIDFGTITKSETESIKTQPIAVSASDVADLDGKSVDVSVTGSFSLSSGENTLPFEVYMVCL